MPPEVQQAYDELSQQYDDIQITDIRGRFFIWRPLSRREYRYIRQLDMGPGKEEELVCALCVLWPADYDWANPEKAGYPTTVCNDILYYSGFLSWEETKKFLAEQEAELETFSGMIDPVISAAFSSIRPEEPQEWTMRHALWVFARAKWVLENIYGRPINFVDPSPSPQASPTTIPTQPQSPVVTPVDGFGPEKNWWPDDLDFDYEEIPEIEGFPNPK